MISIELWIIPLTITIICVAFFVYQLTKPINSAVFEAICLLFKFLSVIIVILFAWSSYFIYMLYFKI